MIALVVMVITFAIGDFWSAAVLLRQLVVRLSRRRALRAFPAANGWEWFARGNDIPMLPDTVRALESCRPVSTENEKKRPKYSELLRRQFHRRPAISFHFERKRGTCSRSSK